MTNEKCSENYSEIRKIMRRRIVNYIASRRYGGLYEMAIDLKYHNPDILRPILEGLVSDRVLKDVSSEFSMGSSKDLVFKIA